MIGLLQRVSRASLTIGGRTAGEIDRGLLVFIGVQTGDDARRGERLLERLLAYRVFADESGRMNRSVGDINGGLLLVPQFTLAADTANGTRPGFSKAAPADLAEFLFNHIVDVAQRQHPTVAKGEFGANMQVSLTNDGPVTFWLES